MYHIKLEEADIAGIKNSIQSSLPGAKGKRNKALMHKFAASREILNQKFYLPVYNLLTKTDAKGHLNSFRL